MTTYYIDPTGDDGTGDGSSGNPWATPNAFRLNGSEDDTLIVNDGTYVFQDLNWAFDFTMQAANRGLAIFDGGDDGAGSSPTANNWRAEAGCESMTFDGLVFQYIYSEMGSSVQPIFYYISGAAGGSMIFTNCTFKNIVVDSYNEFYYGEGLIGVSQVSNNASITVQYCLFNDIRKNGSPAGCPLIMLHTQNIITLIGNTIYLPALGTGAGDRQLDGVVKSNTSGGIVICTNNIVSAPNVSLPFFAAASALTKTLTTNCWHNVTSVPAGSGDITSDPLFVDPDNDNFNLRPTSPCIDTGTLL